MGFVTAAWADWDSSYYKPDEKTETEITTQTDRAKTRTWPSSWEVKQPDTVGSITFSPVAYLKGNSVLSLYYLGKDKPSLCVAILSFHSVENLNPFSRQPTCTFSGDTKILASSLLQNHPSPITLPQVPQLAGPSSSSPSSQFWGWSLMHRRWVQAPNSFQMASQSTLPSNPLYFGYPGIISDTEGPWVPRMAETCSQSRTFERPCILECPP